MGGLAIFIGDAACFILGMILGIALKTLISANGDDEEENGSEYQDRS